MLRVVGGQLLNFSEYFLGVVSFNVYLYFLY